MPEPDWSMSKTPMLFIIIASRSAASPLSISLLSFISFFLFLVKYEIFPDEIIVPFGGDGKGEMVPT